MVDHLPALLTFSIVDGSNWIEEAKLRASDGAADDQFGVSVSLSGNYALVGAHLDDDRGSNSGSAYVFHFDGSGWVEETKLTASDGAMDDLFGWSVSLSRDYALIGANGDDDNGTNSGSAYIFHFDGSNWAEEAKLTASDGAMDDAFGWSVALSGDYALIGANGDDDNGTNSGSAYIFHFDGSNWVEETKIRASDAAAGDNFGNSVSLSGEHALIGAPYDDDNQDESGSAYIFHFDGSNWVEEAKLIASGGLQSAYFGWSVSLSGDYALIGAFYDRHSGVKSGSAYIFHFGGSNWVQEAKLAASDGWWSDYFGYSVSLSGDYALIGSYQDDDNGTNSGSAYLYTAFTPEISVDSSSLSFVVEMGGVATGEFSIYNEGGTPLTLYSLIELIGDDPISITVTPNSGVVPALATLEFYVETYAGNAQPGTYADSIVITSNDPDESVLFIPVTITVVESTVPCDSIDLFQARCRPGGTIQARIVLLNSTEYAGEEVVMGIDGVIDTLTIFTNGTHSKAQTVLTGQALGGHTVSLVSPAGCFSDITVTCSASLGKADEEWLFDEDSGWRADEYTTRGIPATTALLGNYPNPFNPKTEIRFQISDYGWIKLIVFDLLGREVATLVDGFMEPGYHQVTLDASALASGLYIYRLTAGSSSDVKKLVVLK